MAAGLDGITIVDLTQGVSGPFATRLLSQMGARVIKVERPGSGDLVRHWDTGKVKVFDFPPQFSELQSVNLLGPPALGEHTTAILRELGHSAGEIETLARAGVVEQGPAG